jgi:hypothetical protein
MVKESFAVRTSKRIETIDIREKWGRFGRRRRTQVVYAPH